MIDDYYDSGAPPIMAIVARHAGAARLAIFYEAAPHYVFAYRDSAGRSGHYHTLSRRRIRPSIESCCRGHFYMEIES